jgi:glycine oxidase
VNVTVIGAGIVGCAVAHELALRGARVRVVDPRSPGRGATYASAGMLAPHIEGHTPALHALSVRGLSMYDAFVDRLRASSGRSIDYARNGTLQIARDARGAAHLRDEATRLTAAGIVHTLLDGDGVRRAEPALEPGTEAGLLVPEHGYVAVPMLVDALTRGATALGARFVHDRVTGVHGSGERAQVTTTDGTIDGDAVVIAAGTWSPEVAAISSWPPPVKPVRGQLLHLRTERPPLSTVVWGPHCYLVPWMDGSVLVGATSEDAGFDESSTVAGVRDLLNAAVTLVPALTHARFEGVRVGLRPMTSDELPIIGRSSRWNRVFYATGHYRNGILLAALTASMVADLVLEGWEAPELAVTRPSRFGL